MVPFRAERDSARDSCCTHRPVCYTRAPFILQSNDNRADLNPLAGHVNSMFNIGDVCKRSLKHIESGIVVEHKMKLKLEHVLSKQRIDHDVPDEDVQNVIRIVNGDHVVANNWVGVVEEVFEEALVESSDQADLIRVCDIGSRLTVGEVSGESLGSSSGIWASLFSARRTPKQATVLNVKQTVVCVNWLAMNQKLSPEQQQNQHRPKRFWSNVEDLTLVRSFSDSCHAVGDKVIFRHAELVTKHRLEIPRYGVESFPVDVMNVIDTSSTIRILWQDGSITEEDSKTMVPYVNLDEYESWPGDWVVWKGDGGDSKVGIVQRMDPIERTAEVRWYGTEEIETVPSLELDVHGPDPVTFGVHRGDVVFLSNSPTGMQIPSLARLGELEEMPELPELHSLLSKAGMNLARQYPKATPLRLPKQGGQANDVDWYGTVVELHRDGRIKVRLPNKEHIFTTIDRLALLVEGIDDHVHDEWDEDMGSESEFGSEMDMEGDGWVDEAGDELAEVDGWEDMTEDEASTTSNQEEKQHPVEDKSLIESQTADANGSSSHDGPGAGAQVIPPTAAEAPAVASAQMPTNSSRWSRFEVLEEAPRDHAFIMDHYTPPKAAYFKRLQKEFKVLQTSLPDSILVRTYEDRSDLLRVLIVGSEGTPYEDAPFVIDFLLKSTYPQEPPVAHFHSWTNGSGRVSPNLYEEGKVCLSVLGTWSGQAESESWSPTKSSLLQVFVSIQGLVLVREPWFTEPAYEKLKGTEEGEVNSRLYSEKAFILARGFVRRALKSPPSGLEDELRYFYLEGDTSHRPRLPAVIERARALISASETKTDIVPANGDEPVKRISGGGAIVLKRTLAVLEKVWASHRPDSVSSA